MRDLILLLLLIILLLIISNLICYSRYRLYKNKCETLLDSRGIEHHLRKDKQIQRNLEIEKEMVRRLKTQLSDVEKRIGQGLKEINKLHKKK